MTINQFPNRKIIVDSKEYLYFGGTAYLGIPMHKKFQKLVSKNLKKWGTAYGSSPNANVKLSAYANGASSLANFIQSDSAVTVSSGMLAGKLVISQLITETDCFFHFPNVHNALQVAVSLPFFIDGQLNPRLIDNTIEKITILTDAVPTGNVLPIDLRALETISANKKITLVIDESHSLGILGQNGCGIFSSLNFSNIHRKIMISSLGKAMGITGGVIASDDKFIDQIRQNPTFASSAGMNPAFLESCSQAAKIYLEQHQKLQKNLDFLNKNLVKSDKILFDVSYPLLYPNIPNIYATLKENHIIITNFPYPNDSGELNRIVITANHKKKDLQKLIAVLNALQQ